MGITMFKQRKRGVRDYRTPARWPKGSRLLSEGGVKRGGSQGGFMRSGSSITSTEVPRRSRMDYDVTPVDSGDKLAQPIMTARLDVSGCVRFGRSVLIEAWRDLCLDSTRQARIGRCRHIQRISVLQSSLRQKEDCGVSANIFR